MNEERGNGLFLNSKYWSYLAQVGIVAVIYFGIAKLSLALTGHPSPVWPPAGFALAVILLFGYRLWPGIAMGMFMEVILEGLPVPIAFATAAGSAAGALAGAYLFNRLGFRNSMERPRDVLGLVVLGSAVSPTISATSGALSFYLSGIILWAASGSFWMTWWLGDMLGVIVVAPVFLAWSIRPRFDLKPMQIPEALALLALLVLVSDFIFSRPVAYIGYEYMLFPILIWAALRFGQKGATTAIIILSGIAIWHTAHGYGPFVLGTPAENLIILQIFTSVVALTIMTLAAIVQERNLIEATLRKEKMFIEDALNGLQDVFFVLDVNGRFLRWNNALTAITGYSDKEISAKKLGDFFLGEDIRNISNAIEMVAKNGTAKVEAKIVTKNGEHINYEFTGTMLRDSKGKHLGVCGAGRNITELKRAALEYKAILHTTMDGFYRVDTQGRILDVNDSYCSLIGYSREELLNMSLKDIDVLDTEEDIAQRIKRVMENGWDRFETRHKCKDGRIVEIEASVNYDKAGGGKFFAFMRDITEQKRVLEELQESEEKYRTLINNIQDGVFIIQDGKLKFVNDSFAYMCGYRVEEMIGFDFKDLVAPEDLEMVLDRYSKRQSGKDVPSEYEFRVLHKNGGMIIVNMNVGIITYRGEVASVGTLKDITERKRADELHIENIRLEHESKEKSEFLASMSHELRTPLNAIIGFSDIMTLGIGGNLNETQKDYVKDIHNAGKHLLLIINDILDLSKVEAGKMELVIEKFSVDELLEETITLIKIKALKNNINIIRDIDSRLEFMDGDKQKIKQVLFNLLSNAVKFSKDDGGTITILAKKMDGIISFSVSDTGIGIEKKNLNKLFKQFQQVDSGISRKYGGTGLGLVISKKFVELHRGKICAESKYGEGSTFTFSIPVQHEVN